MGDCRNFKAAAMHAVLFPVRAWVFSVCFNSCRAGEQRGLREKELPGSIWRTGSALRGSLAKVNGFYSSVFLGGVEKLFALEVIFWRVFICTFNRSLEAFN